MRSSWLVSATLASCATSGVAGELFPHVTPARRCCALPNYDYSPVRQSLPVAAPTFTAVLVERNILAVPLPPDPVPFLDPLAVGPPPSPTAGLWEVLPGFPLPTASSPLRGGPLFGPQLPPSAVVAAVEPRIRFFQLAEQRLVVNHCAVARVGVSLWDDGRWVVNLRAEQSPPFIPADIAEPAARFRRNRFFIEVRAYGNYAVREDVDDAVLGKPELLRIEVPAFWLERGEVREVRAEGRFPPVPRDLPPGLPPGLAVQDIFGRVNRMEVEFRIE